MCLFGNINSQTTQAREFLSVLNIPVESSTIYFNNIVKSKNRVEASQWIDSLKNYTEKCLIYLKKRKVFDNNTALKNSCDKYILHLNKISKKELPKFYSFYYNSKHTQKDFDDSKKNRTDNKH